MPIRPESLRIKALRGLIREYINTWHKNFHTVAGPVHAEDFPEINVERNMDSNGNWSVRIDCRFDDTLSEPTRIFKTEEDASAYSRRKADNIRKVYLNSGNL
jgi:hypothetical protein